MDAPGYGFKTKEEREIMNKLLDEMTGGKRTTVEDRMIKIGGIDYILIADDETLDDIEGGDQYEFID
jgi:hypothetical protein